MRQHKIRFSPRDRCGGFTLIEILIVLFIISIVSGAALLSVSHNSNKQIESFANELTQQLSLAEEQAILQPMMLGISFTKESYQFLTYRVDEQSKKNKTNWIALNDTILKPQSIPYGIQIDLRVGNTRVESFKKNEPQIIVSTNGDLSPFEIYIAKEGQKPSYVVIGKSDGTIDNKALF